MSSKDLQQPIKLLLVTNTLAPGGAEAMLVQLALALDPNVVQPVVICFKEPGIWADKLAARSIPVHSYQLKHKLDIRVIGRLSRLIKQYEPACVMAVGSGGDRMFWSTLAARRMGVPMLVWAHIFPVPERLEFEWINRRLYSRVDRFIALGQKHRGALVALEKIPADRLQVIRNGVNVAEFEDIGLYSEARKRLGVDSDRTIVVGIIANLRADKRHDLFIEAAVKTRALREHCRFVIIGDGSERARIEKMVRNQDPGGEFIAMLGARDDVPVLIQGLDIVCLTSKWHECLSIAMLEAMAAAKPFVSSRIGSLDEVLIDGLTGRFFEPLSADALVSILIELIDRPQERAALGRRAQEKVRAEFTVDRMAREFETLIVDVCRKHCP